MMGAINGSAQTTKNGILATVNDVKISVAQLEEVIRFIKVEGGNVGSDIQAKLLEDILLKEAINQDVIRQGLLKKPENQFKLKLAQQNVTFDIWFAEYLKKNPVTETDIKAEYEAQVKRSREPRNKKEFNVSQIVLADEIRANELIKELNVGASFDNLAKKYSQHKQSADNGGSLGWVLPTQLVSPLGDVVLNLPKSKVGALAVRTSFGWHVVRVNDIRDYIFPSFEQVKAQISNYLMQQRRAQAIAELMAKTKVVKN